MLVINGLAGGTVLLGSTPDGCEALPKVIVVLGGFKNGLEAGAAEAAVKNGFVTTGF